MHVLVTADTMSGSWTYTRELVTGLVTRGVRVTLVSFGEIPLPEQTAWMDLLHGLEYRPTAFRLEWMDEAPRGPARIVGVPDQPGPRSYGPTCFTCTSSAMAICRSTSRAW